MKNIKVFDYFINNCDLSFVIRFLKISLSRTFIFNLNNDDVYYRKANVVRKISFKGKERAFLLTDKYVFNNVNFDKYGIKSIDKVINEYADNDVCFDPLIDSSFDIVEKKRKSIITSDSTLRKISRDELVTMCFDDSHLIFNNLKNSSQYEKINI